MDQYWCFLILLNQGIDLFVEDGIVNCIKCVSLTHKSTAISKWSAGNYNSMCIDCIRMIRYIQTLFANFPRAFRCPTFTPYHERWLSDKCTSTNGVSYITLQSNQERSVRY
jgi:hypothetical protein